jgi:mono/diheme cytochrome c family protein
MRDVTMRSLSPHTLLSIAAAWLLLSSVTVAQYEGWTVPATGKTEKSPFAASADAVRKGKTVFQGRCQRCHGPEGKGNGPEADPKAKPADLTKIDFAENPEGVLFYKVWNGRQAKGGSKSSMPAFKVQLVKEDVWRAVEYVKTLRPTT